MIVIMFLILFRYELLYKSMPVWYKGSSRAFSYKPLISVSGIGSSAERVKKIKTFRSTLGHGLEVYMIWGTRGQKHTFWRLDGFTRFVLVPSNTLNIRNVYKIFERFDWLLPRFLTPATYFFRPSQNENLRHISASI